ncbi:L,D-transpeptidase [Methylobacterium sp. B4]|uniref:L,D-transpeptidase n=1 Tax=Methylobacterium sp. B4 TaxID=1938755 RepID=UPI000D756FE7|nr:L,D-transpeptidase [Methylobacterium sp. B4]PXW66861.1 L,D-transpeptidase-like protein [Methylobacterium sp. B4]
MRVKRCATAAIAIAMSSQVAAAQAEPGRYGGGFIEYLMTGSAAGQPRASGVDGYGSLGPARAPVAVEPRTRFAALPNRAPLEEGAIARAVDPRYARQVIGYDGPGRPGQIVIDTGAKYLYLIQPGGQAIRYGIGVGRPGFVWTGAKTITAKREWPDWTPPAEMLRRRPDLPRHMVGGPENPLGARAMYLGTSLYRIHGTNEPHTIGQNVSSGCIRMMNEDVIDLYERTPVGTRVDVI